MYRKLNDTEDISVSNEHKYQEVMRMKYRIISIMTALAALLMLSLNVYAAEAAALTQAFIIEENLDIFTSGSFDAEKLKVKAANREAEIIGSGTLSEKNISVHTTILIDISTSMPFGARQKVAEFIDLTIQNLPKNEQLRIVTFGAEIKVLQDLTSDRYDLDKAAESIVYDGQQSAVYDAVYNTLPKADTSDNKPCFYRTIVLTDGADYATGGITKEELFLELKNRTYPLDIICVSAAKPASQNKDLSALTRISGGRYLELYPETDAASLVSGTSVGDYFWIRAEVPVALLDGSTRQIDVSDGTNSLSFDMKMSVVDATPPAESGAVSSSSSRPASSSRVTLPYSTASDTREAKTEEFPLIPVLIIAGASAAVIAAAVVVMVLVKKKRSPSNTIQNSFHPTHNELPQTIFVDDDADKQGHYTIKISNTADQSESWILDVFSDIIIGRAENCAIVIDDKSVSREQCKIAANKNGLAISNLSSTNKTKLNGTGLATEILLHPADNIHFGRITLRVDYIQKVTDDTPPQTPPPSSNDGRTISMF